MAEHDSDPLSDEERAELEQLRAEKAARVAQEQARRDRAELEELRKEKAQIGAARGTAPAKKSASKTQAAQASSPVKTKRPAAGGDNVAKSAQKREDMSFAVRMVTSTDPKDEDDIPGMAPAQKIIIVLALIAFAFFIGYSVLNSTGALH